MSQTPPPPPPPPAAAATGQVGEIRSPVTVSLLTLVTCGIYGIYWYYKSFDEMKVYSGEGVGGAVGLLLTLFCGIVAAFLLPSEVGNLYARDGKEKPVSAVTAFWNLIPILGFFIFVAKVQGALNDYWTSKGATKS
jgi:hypothetical protein